MKRFTGEIILGLLLIALVAPALGLPWSLIDDALYFVEIHRLLLQFGLASQIAHFDFSAYAQPHNPWALSRFIGASEQLIAGETVWVYHAFKLVDFLVCAMLLYFIVFYLGGERRAARLGVVLFALFSPINYSSDCQAYLANWYRLHATDSVLVPFYLLILLCLVLILKRSMEPQNVEAKGARVGIALIVLLLLSVFVKQTIVAVPIAMALFWVVLVATRQQKRVCVFWGMLTAAGITVVVAAMLIMRIAIRVANVSYFEEYSFASTEIRERFSKYLSYLVVGLGPLFYVALGSFVYRLGRTAVDKLRLSVAQLGQVFLLILTLCGLLVYTPWPHILPRYMPIMVAPLVSFVAIEVMALWKECQWPFQLNVGIAGIWLGAAVAGILAALLILLCLPSAGKAICLLVLAGVATEVIVGLRRTMSVGRCLQALLAMVMIVVVLLAVVVFVLMGLMANVHFIRNYTTSETVNAQMVEELAAHLPAGGDLFFILPKDAELAGSIDLLLRLFHGKPNVRSAYVEPDMHEPIPEGALLLYHSEYSPILMQGTYRLIPDQRSDVRSFHGRFISTNSACGQTFIAGPKTHCIPRIVVLLDNSYMDPSEQVVLTLWDSPKRRHQLGVSVLRGAERPGSNPDQVSFPFAEPVSVEPGQSYYFELTYQGRQGLPGRFTLFTPRDVYEHGRAYIGGVAKDFDMIFLTCAGWPKPLDIVWEGRERVVSTLMEPWPRVLKSGLRWGFLGPRYRLLRKAQDEYEWIIYRAQEPFVM
jgi:hypothetical protein